MTSDLLARVRSEIDTRLAELRPALAEHERLLSAYAALEADTTSTSTPRSSRPARSARRRGPRGSAAGAIARAASAPRSAAQQAIVAALEHGSHTVAELVLVTAIAGAEIRDSVRRLQRAGTITRTKRDGRAAYALSSSASD
jgi:hypothetical protein